MFRQKNARASSGKNLRTLRKHAVQRNTEIQHAERLTIFMRSTLTDNTDALW
jgi:hypothetical protein